MPSEREMTVTLRGEEVTVYYTDSGYDPETNDSGIDFWFEDGDRELTDEEELMICERIAERSSDDLGDFLELGIERP